MWETAISLTARQARFVQEYLLDLNATQAAVRAGYAPRTANREGTRLLSNAVVAAAVAAAQAKRADRVQLSQDEVLAELRDVLRSDVRDFEVADSGMLTLRPQAPDRAWRAVQSVKHKITTRTLGHATETDRDIEIRLWSKTDAIRLAMQHLGMLVEKHEHTGKDGAPLHCTFVIGEGHAGDD